MDIELGPNGGSRVDREWTLIAVGEGVAGRGVRRFAIHSRSIRGPVAVARDRASVGRERASGRRDRGSVGRDGGLRRAVLATRATPLLTRARLGVTGARVPLSRGTRRVNATSASGDASSVTAIDGHGSNDGERRFGRRQLAMSEAEMALGEAELASKRRVVVVLGGRPRDGALRGRASWTGGRDRVTRGAHQGRGAAVGCARRHHPERAVLRSSVRALLIGSLLAWLIAAAACTTEDTAAGHATALDASLDANDDLEPGAADARADGACAPRTSPNCPSDCAADLQPRCDQGAWRCATSQSDWACPAMVPTCPNNERASCVCRGFGYRAQPPYKEWQCPDGGTMSPDADASPPTDASAEVDAPSD